MDETPPCPDEPRNGAVGSQPDSSPDAHGATNDGVRDTILSLLSGGQSLSEICSAEGMPNRSTVQRWQNDDEEFDAAVTHARETGFERRAIAAVRDAKTADDAAKGRLAFDAERWYLGKLSNAFSDNKPQKQELSGKLIHGIEIEFVNKAED